MSKEQAAEPDLSINVFMNKEGHLQLEVDSGTHTFIMRFEDLEDLQDFLAAIGTMGVLAAYGVNYGTA
jgi:hypothetical protein